MRSAQIIPIRPYLLRRHAECDREAAPQWAAFEARIEDAAAASWNLDGVPGPMIWTLSHLQEWDEIVRFFGLDARA